MRRSILSFRLLLCALALATLVPQTGGAVPIVQKNCVGWLTFTATSFQPFPGNLFWNWSLSGHGKCNVGRPNADEFTLSGRAIFVCHFPGAATTNNRHPYHEYFVTVTFDRSGKTYEQAWFLDKVAAHVALLRIHARTPSPQFTSIDGLTGIGTLHYNKPVGTWQSVTLNSQAVMSFGDEEVPGTEAGVRGC